MGTMGLSVLPPRYGDTFYTGRGRGRGRREPIGKRPFDRNSIQGIGRGSSQDLEGEMEEDFIPKAL